MPRLIRKRPILERIKDSLHPGDWLLWISEELETRDWDAAQFGNIVALASQLLTLVARANVVGSRSPADDVFGDGDSKSGWLNYLASFTVFILSTFSILNAVYTFSRKRYYRLFESSINAPKPTTSARRVKVQSSPMSSSPLRLLTNMIGDLSAESRAHPNEARDVWEIGAWDPLPVCLRIFCLFSPGHVLIYWLFIPTSTMDPRPSVTVVKTIILQSLMTIQLFILQKYFSQQKKDSSIIHGEVMNEYNTKFVHPRLNPVVRDVGTQFTGSLVDKSSEKDSVTTYTPSVILKRGFRTNPNPNFEPYVDPEYNPASTLRHNISSPVLRTPVGKFSGFTPSSGASLYSGMNQSHLRRSMAGNINPTGESTSISQSYTKDHIRKATSMHSIRSGISEALKNPFQNRSQEVQHQGDTNHRQNQRPSDRSRLPQLSTDDSPLGREILGENRRMSGPPSILTSKSRVVSKSFERGPSRI